MGCPPAGASRKTPDGAGEGGFAGLHGGWGQSTRPALVRGQPSSTISSLWSTQPWGSQCPRSRWPTRRQGTQPSLQEARQEDPRRQWGGQGPRRNGHWHTVECNHLPSTKCEKAARPGQSVAGGCVSPGAAPQPEAHITDPLTAWRPEVQDQVSAGSAPRGVRRENPSRGSVPASSGCWRSLVSPAGRCLTPIPASSSRGLSPHESVPRFPSKKVTSRWIRIRPNPGGVNA